MPDGLARGPTLQIGHVHDPVSWIVGIAKHPAYQVNLDDGDAQLVKAELLGPDATVLR